MLHGRPSSADAFQSPPQQFQQSPRLGQTPRSMYNGANNTSYRGTSASPVQPYAFQSTPHLRQETRTASAPPTPAANSGGLRQPAHAPSASISSSDTSSVPSAKDDSVMGSRPSSTINLSQLPDLSFTPFDPQVKSSPDRYRRPAQKRVDSNNATPKASAQPSGSGMGSVSHLYQPQQPTPQRHESVDDMAVPKSKESEAAKRYRRRSLNTLDTQNLAAPQAGAGAQRPSSGHGPSATSTPTTIRPVSFQSQGSSEDGQGVPRNVSQTSLQTVESSSQSARLQEVTKPAVQKNVSIPPRGSSDANKRLGAPSPLSRQADGAERPASAAASSQKTKTYAAVAQSAVSPSPSAAAAQLAAVSDKDLNKGMKSRLRRAFSFGSAQELRRAAGENQQAASHAAQHARERHQQRVDDELDAEQQEIARRQEAAGIGAGIYSGQGGFSGSTDNLSISSTASSASMMLRKIGRGTKKSAKSIKGLFRPKSVIGVPAADGPVQVAAAPIVQPTVAQVSMVTVEAERQKVNVNADPAEKVGGETGFPKLERNSIDAANATAMAETRGSADGSDSRRSIVGSDKDRAEVLAAVKKGILKRSGTGSPSGSPVIRPSDAGMTPIPQLGGSPTTSVPSTPKDGAAQGRSTSLNGDYFSQRLQATMTKSMPNTPNGLARNISFSPRIQFHDAWSSTEYDRRGEIATCNRLTPMLAQQIKEELNTFKMEMEVHEMSKPHTHFF
ncbi:hypothetical protein LTR36_006233 [Oleoguttula mirabilis]|uniref:Protein BNI4 n=1 Tax=Oleoguttula mirabilis TaxID=1507867 RepID=A0AAV9JBZ4_9PEZI|nr:hypothetical protein LTR36_006233 [Oleoguttula mirabilis]